MKGIRRIISFLLALVMVIGMVPPMDVSAEETEPTQAVTEAMEETTAPTETVTESAAETTAPTENAADPVEETTVPTEAETEPTEETTVPTEAVAEISAPTESAAEFEEVEIPEPVLTYRRVICSEDGLWGLEDWDETANGGLYGEDELTFAPGEYWLVFYLNSWDAESESWEHTPVHVEFGEYLSGELMEDGEYTFHEDAEGTEYYFHLTVNEEDCGKPAFITFRIEREVVSAEVMISDVYITPGIDGLDRTEALEDEVISKADILVESNKTMATYAMKNVYVQASSLAQLSCKSFISNVDHQKYIDKMIEYYISENSNLLSALNNGLSVVFMFEGGSDNYPSTAYSTSGSNVRNQAVTIVIQKNDGQYQIVFYEENSSSIPGQPEDTTGAASNRQTTLMDGIYGIETCNHKGQYGALHVKATKGYYTPTSNKDGLVNTASGINIHTRSSNTSGVGDSAWSWGCQLIGVGNNTSNSFNEFMKTVTDIDYNVWLSYSSKQFNTITAWKDVGYYVIDRQLALSGLTTMYNSTALSAITEYSSAARIDAEGLQSVSFHPNGGTCSESSKLIEEGSAIGTLPTPTFDGMAFDGWYTEPYGGTKISSSYVVTKDITVYAHYRHNTNKILFNANGGMIPGAVQSDTIDGINIGRPAASLVVFDQSGITVDTNTYGAEVAVGANGKVVASRSYGVSSQLKVPEDGFVLSGHSQWSDGVQIGGIAFVEDVIALYNENSDVFVSLDYETGSVKLFDSHAGYLNESKYLEDGATYGILPVPEKSGYVLRGWKPNSGVYEDISYYSTYSATSLLAEWEAESSVTPDASVTYNGHKYELYNNMTSWLKAKEICESKGGYLAVITNAGEQAAVTSLTVRGNRGSYYIGATDSEAEGNWKWVNGEAFSYSNWDINLPEPSAGKGENYSAIVAIENLPNKQVGEWMDCPNVGYGGFYDVSNIGFICEYDTTIECKHSYVSKVVTEPTLSSGGQINSTCSLCGQLLVTAIPELNSYDYACYVISDATCMTDGRSEFLWENEEIGEFLFEAVIPKTDHSYQGTHTEASCNEHGYTTYTCSGCGDSYIVYDEQGWSDWSTTYPSNASKIESRTEYRYQDKETTTSTQSTMAGWTQYNKTSAWGPYGAWSSWSDSAISTNDSTKVETRTVYGYKYFLCPNCGAHMHGTGTCYSWAGGCGKSFSGGWHAVWSPVSWDDAGLKDWHGTGDYYTYLDGELVFKWKESSSKTQYRSCTRQMVDTYHFYRWTDWSDWSDTAYTSNDNRKVETRTVYRYLKELPGHTYSYKVTKSPTTAAAGTLTGTCGVCSITTSVTLPKLNTADYTYKVTKAATCKATGTARYTWNTTTYGSYYFDVTLPTTNHSYASKITAPNCTEQGYTTHTCSVCGDNYKDTYVKELGHSWDSGVVTKAPSETETGIRTYTCGRCATTKTEVIPVLEHKHSYTAVVTAPKCIEKGYTTHTCSSCGDSYVDTYVDALDHSWDSGKITTAATCTQNGVKTFICTRCSETKTEGIQKIDHSYKASVTDPTCTEKGYTMHTCSVCGDSYADTYVNVLEHDFVNGVCSVCNANDSNILVSGICGDSVKWSLNNSGLLTIWGEGAIYDYGTPGSSKDSPWIAWDTSYLHNRILTVVVEEGVTHIGNYSFENCRNITSVTLPESLSTIGYSAFSYCTKLNNIILPTNLAIIDGYAFFHCWALKSIDLPESLTSLYYTAFYGSGLTEIIYPSKLSSVGGCGGCSDLERVIISKGPTIVNSEAFYNCKSLKEIVLPEGIVDIYSSAFSRCTSLESITIPSTIEAIYGSAFSQCENLKKVNIIDLSSWCNLSNLYSSPFSAGKGNLYVNDELITELIIPEGVTSICNSAFASCSSISSILVPASVTTIGAGAFSGCVNVHEIYFNGDAPVFENDRVFSSNVVATAYYPADNDTWTEEKRNNYGGTITWVPYGAVENRITVNISDLSGQSSVWIDGKECAVQANGDTCYIDLPDGNAKTMVSYTYHVDDASEVHNQYPTCMKVWTLKNEDGIYTATRVEELDNILQYSGSSIRVAGKQGIRMITSIEKSKKNSLISDGLASYILKEYGTVVAWASRLDDNNPLVLGQSYTVSNYAYKKGIADPVFAYDGDLMQYTNVLVNFSLDQCKDDLAMRPYMILEDAEGNEIILYGGIVQRSIGYIAAQNANTFDPATEANAYNYVWDIIHHVYGEDYEPQAA